MKKENRCSNYCRNYYERIDNFEKQQVEKLMIEPILLLKINKTVI